jgi:hypothetical protein
MILPPLDVSLRDKLMIFETFRAEMPMPTLTDEERAKFRAAIAAELPSFLAYLLKFEIPAQYRTESRYGIDAYRSPVILEALGELQPEHQLMEYIDQEIFGIPSSDPWEGTATKLESALRSGNLRELVGKLLRHANACGALLSRLAENPNGRVERRTLHGRSFYKINPPPKDQKN